jgi:hypothetical protein
MMSRRPLAIALLTCEQVIVEESTRNITPVNCFVRRDLRDFPSEPTSSAVAAFLTDGQGEFDLELLIQRLEDLEVLYRDGRRFRFGHPLSEYRCIFRVRDFSFPAEGSYEIMLKAGGEMVAARRIKIARKG